MSPHELHSISRLFLIPAILAGSLAAASAAAAACQQPRMTQLTERFPNCTIRNCGFLVAHWAGAPGCDHYNIRDQFGKQIEAPGTNRNQLHNQRSAAFPWRYAPNGAEIRVAVQGCTRNIFGKSSCGAWSQEATFRVNPAGPASPKVQACETYAKRAVGALKYARDVGCDTSKLTGPRWAPDEESHRVFCMRSAPATSNAEDRARNQIAQACRIEAGRPKGGKANITVTARAGDTFTIAGSGFAPNAPVIIRLSGPGAAVSAVTVANNQRIVADARGNISVRLFGAQICKRGGGLVNFTAEDQDNPASPAVSARCAA